MYNGGSRKWKLISAVLILALISVIIYFLIFHNTTGNVLTTTTFFPDGKSTYILSNTNFNKTINVNKTGDIYLFTSEDGSEYNFELPTPPAGYEIKTLTGKMFFIKSVDKDEILQYTNDKFSTVTSKIAFSDNTNLMKSAFLFTPEPSYDTIIMGPTGKKREGGILKTIEGDVDVCKMECSEDDKCIGFNTDGTSCELKTLHFNEMVGDVKTGLGPYTDDSTTQYWYKSNTYGNSNTYIGSLGHFTALSTDTWNQGQTIKSCIDELTSPSNSTLTDHGFGYDSVNKQCLFSNGTIPDPIIFNEALGKDIISMCIDPNADIISGCK